MIKSFLKTGVLLLLLVPCAVTHAQFFSNINHPELEWFEIETEHFLITHHNGAEAFARRVAVIAEEVYEEAARLRDEIIRLEEE